MQLTVKSNTYIYLTILLFLVPLPWLTSWFIAACIHELCHYLAVRGCQGRVERLTISVGGAQMYSTPMSDVKRVICTLSGPVGGLLPVILYRTFPRVAICAWILSAYNLLPLLPLDGGHVLLILMSNSKWFSRMQTFLLAAFVLFGIYALVVMKIGILPLTIAVILFVKNRKTPCKKGSRRVQ